VILGKIGGSPVTVKEALAELPGHPPEGESEAVNVKDGGA
jgi:hypothetical protein